MHALEKEMATHSSILAWRILGTEEPGGLPSMGLHGVGHDCSDLTAAAEVAKELGVGVTECHLLASVFFLNLVLYWEGGSLFYFYFSIC